MKTLWTPGPWEATENYNWGGKRLNISKIKGHNNLAFVSSLLEYDAFLIAAAPDLYIALEKATEAMRTLKVSILVDEFEKVLKKARGES